MIESVELNSASPVQKLYSDIFEKMALVFVYHQRHLFYSAVLI